MNADLVRKMEKESANVVPATVADLVARFEKAKAEILSLTSKLAATRLEADSLAYQISEALNLPSSGQGKKTRAAKPRTFYPSIEEAEKHGEAVFQLSGQNSGHFFVARGRFPPVDGVPVNKAAKERARKAEK